MIIKLLTNPLSKGEKWEKKNTREIEITESIDNRGGAKPNVYFGIIDGKRITEDFFLPTDTAREIAKAIIKQADLIDKNFLIKTLKRKK